MKNRRTADMDTPEMQRLMELFAQHAAEKATSQTNAATPRQIVYLRELGVGQLPADLTKTAASQMINNLKAGRAGGYLGYGEDHGDNVRGPELGNLPSERYGGED